MTTSTADPWQALADPTRRRVFARVAGGPCSVTEIARELPVSRPAVSQHLLVDVHQQGRMRMYEMRANGLDEMRRELDSYWRKTLTRFKDVAERSYQPTPTTAEGTPPR
jgi:DNA-binding transcriptional ArsR family regulator